MTDQVEPDTGDYWSLTPVRIAGVDRTGELWRAGRIEEARDHFISSARAVFTRRWPTIRRDRIRRLGEALDLERHPELADLAGALIREESEAPARFLEYLRGRTDPEVHRYILAPRAPADIDALAADAGAWSFPLWSAWRATGDERLKRGLDQRLARILDPIVPASWHETAYYWVRLVFSALHHGGIDDRTLCELILFGLDYAEFVNSFAHHVEPPQTSIGGNWIFYWTFSGLTAVTVFPEFRRSPALRDSLLARMDDELSRQVMPDGSMIEGVPGYQNCCLNLFGDFLDFCGVHRLPVGDRTRAAIRRLATGAIKWIKPDGRTPMFGDSQDDVFRQVAWPVGPHFDLPELRWALSGGTEGTPPAYTSSALECIGYYAFRDGWTPEACCLVFDGGRMGQAHFHEDKLNFEINAFGRPFIVDPGIHSYTDYWLRNWLTVAQAHNVILLDGVGQCRWRQDRDQWYSDQPIGNPCRLGGEWEGVEAEFDGPYERDIGPVRQRRRVLFHKGDRPFWWITDWVEGEGTFDVAELFHLAHDIEHIRVLPAGVCTELAGGPNLAILYFAEGSDGIAPDRPEIRSYRGALDPPRGWVSPARNQEAPAWEVHFAGRSPLPVRRDFLLLPWRGEFPRGLEVSYRRNAQESVLAFSVGAERRRFRFREEGVKILSS